MRALIAPLALCATLLASPALAFPIETTTGLNLRSGPSSAYPVLATMPPGEVVHLEFCQGTWCRVQFRATAGWASADHLARIPGRPFPWEGAERAALAYPFDRPAVAAAGPPGDVLREAAPIVAAPPPLERAAEPEPGPEIEPEPAAPRTAAVDPVPEPPAALPKIEPKVKPSPSPPPRASAPERADRLAREPGAADDLRRIGPAGASGRDVL